MLDLHVGPITEASRQLHSEKYREEGEGFREAMNRIAAPLTDDPSHFYQFRDIILNQRFLPAGRIQTAVGSKRQTTPYNCYVSGSIADSFVDDEGSIMQRASEAARTMRMGGGIGYDFSTLRPKGELIRKLQSHSSGPVAFMQIFNAVCLATSSSGHRRGAQMGVMRVDHPDIVEFVRAKQNSSSLNGFNISVAITDEFMEALSTDDLFELKWGGKAYSSIRATDLWAVIMRSTWDWAEPGVLFIDRINEMNNLYYCEKIAATNPCGEQPLPPFGACLLGSFNLVKYLRKNTDGSYYFEIDAFTADIPPVVRAMDNVVDYARYPLHAQENEAKNKRRMGLGVTGLANAGEACGFPYGTPSFIEFEKLVITALRDASYSASSALAEEKGYFRLFDKEAYLSGKYISTLPEEIRYNIKKHGIRNSHLTSIAPTGTISACADNVSSGLEPVFAYKTRRPINTINGPREVEISDYGYEFLGVRGRSTKDITADEHVGVLAAASLLVDSAVSKTCNVDGKMPWGEFNGIYIKAWELRCKGITTFNQDGKRGALLVEVANPDEAEACRIDPITGMKECG